MNRAQQLLTLLSGGAAATYAEYVADTIAPLVWLRMQEPSGTTAVNSGSLGAAENGVISGNVTVAQTGLLGTTEAYLIGEDPCNIQCPQNAALNGMTEFTCWFTVYATDAGGLNTGSFMDKTSSILFRLADSTRKINAVTYYTGGTGNAQSTTSTVLPLNEWCTVALTINNTDKLSRVYLNGVECNYQSQMAGDGTRVVNTQALNFANNNLTREWHGYFDEVMIVDRQLSPAEILALDTKIRA